MNTKISIDQEIKHKSAQQNKKVPYLSNCYYLDRISEYKTNISYQNISMPILKSKCGDGQQFNHTTGYNHFINPAKPVIVSEDVSLINKEEQDAFKDEMFMISSLWKDLGVTNDYIQEFNQFKMCFDDSNNNKYKDRLFMKEMFAMEKVSLICLKDALIKLSKEIEKRETAINFLRIIHFTNDEEYNRKGPSESLFSEVTQAIKSLRMHSINIVNHMMKIRELGLYSILYKKYDLNHLKKTYLFDMNYMIKMKYDLNFLYDTDLRKYYCFAKKNDPFLLSISVHDDNDQRSHMKTIKDSKDKINKQHRTVPITEEMLEAIKKCIYIMLQDHMFFQLNKQRMSNNAQNNQINRGISANQLRHNHNQMLTKKTSPNKKITITNNNTEEMLHIMNSNKMNEKAIECVFKPNSKENINPKSNEEKVDPEKQKKIKEKNIKKDKTIKCNNSKDYSHHFISLTEPKIKSKSELKFKRKLTMLSNINESLHQSNFIITYHKSSISSLITTLSSRQYFNSILPNIKAFFNITSDSFQNCSFITGINPRILLCTPINSNEYCGICQLSYAKSQLENIRKLSINHLSTTSEDWQSVFAAFIDFIKGNFAFDQLYLKFWYKDNAIPTELMKFFKITQGFIWDTCKKVNAVERLQEILLLSEVKENDNNKEGIKDNGKAFELETATIMSIANKDCGDKDNKAEINDKHINLFNVLYLFNQIKANQGYEFLLNASKEDNSNSESFSSLLANTVKENSITSQSIIKLQQELASFIILCDDSIESIKAFLQCRTKFNLSTINTSPLENNMCLTMSSFASFKSILTTSYNNFLYTRISCQIRIMKGSFTMYLIPTDNNNLSMIVFELTDDLKKKCNESTMNIYDIFYDEYQSLSEQDLNQQRTLWLPSFEIDIHLSSKGLNCLSKIVINNSNGKEEIVRSVDEYIKAKYGYTMNDTAFEIQPNENDIVIKRDFAIGLFNYDVLKVMNIPAIILMQVNQRQWVKSM